MRGSAWTPLFLGFLAGLALTWGWDVMSTRLTPTQLVVPVSSYATILSIDRTSTPARLEIVQDDGTVHVLSMDPDVTAIWDAQGVQHAEELQPGRRILIQYLPFRREPLVSSIKVLPHGMIL